MKKRKEEGSRSREDKGMGAGTILCRMCVKQYEAFQSYLGQQDRLYETANCGKGSNLKMPCRYDGDTFSSSQ